MTAVAVLTTIVALVVVASGASKPQATGLQMAQAAVAKYLKKPTSMGLPPITKPIPTGKKVVYVHCGVAACTVLADGAKKAAEILGWKYQTIATDGTPESVKKAWQTANRLKADVVLGSGYDRSIYEQELKDLNARGGIASIYATLTNPSADLPISIGLPKDVGREGQQSAAWTVASTKGKASTLYVNLPSFTILGPILDSYKADYKKFCATCKLDVMDMPITSIGKDSTDRVISYLRAHKDVNFVMFSVDVLGIGFPAALKAAGLDTKVQFAGHSPSVENLGYIDQGLQGATVNQDYYAVMATLIDGAARKMVGLPVTPDNKWSIPYFIESKGHLASTTGFGPVMPDFYGQLKKLWGKA
jgi:ribose transport system substrate-binding protein